MRYIVKSGDTLSGIAERYGSTVADIASASGVSNPDMIYTGQVLTIPDAGSDDVRNALNACINAIDDLPEFRRLEDLLK